MEKAIYFWSGGKDSALGLYKILQEGKYDVVSLVTTISTDIKRVSMHGVREELVELQAKNISGRNGKPIPLKKMYINSQPVNQEYEKILGELLQTFKEEGVKYVIFADLFLEDLKSYRDKLLKEHGMKGVYPLWKIPTSEIIQELFELHFKAIICCCDSSLLGDHLPGKIFDEDLVKSLPPEVDPCGENGEFHTFVFSAPIFRENIPVKIGEKILKIYSVDPEKKEEKGFWFIDILTEEV